MLKLRTEDLEWRQIDDEIVALDARRAEYLGVDGSAVELWGALCDGASRDQLITKLVERYRISRERAGADVDNFVAELASRELLVA